MPDPQAKPSQGAEREQQVQTIFSEIAPRYDLLNHVLSANIDRAWRRKAIDLLGWESHRDGIFLDACAGTYDLSLELAKRPEFTGTVVASDFAQPMLVVGQPKLQGADVAPVCGDSLRLPFQDEVFHGATVGFGVRNLSDLDAGFLEFKRVLKPGAKLVVLEFTVPGAGGVEGSGGFPRRRLDAGHRRDRRDPLGRGLTDRGVSARGRRLHREERPAPPPSGGSPPP